MHAGAVALDRPTEPSLFRYRNPHHETETFEMPTSQEDRILEAIGKLAAGQIDAVDQIKEAVGTQLGAHEEKDDERFKKLAEEVAMTPALVTRLLDEHVKAQRAAKWDATVSGAGKVFLAVVTLAVVAACSYAAAGLQHDRQTPTIQGHP
jgi:hypothetical protein